MRRKLALITTLVLLLATAGWAQQVVSDTQGLGTVPGTGARALGMGGAFTALADDPTAASWNPAGLAQLERPEILLVYGWYGGARDLNADWVGTFDPDRQCGDPGNPVTTGCSEKRVHDFYSGLNDTDIAFFGGVYPFRLGGRQLVAAGSYRRVLSIPEVVRRLVVGSRFYGANDMALPEHSVDTRVENDFWGGGVDAYSASLATQLGARFRLGVTLSYVDADSNQTYSVRETYWADATRPRVTTLEAKYKFSDFQADLGAQWQVVEGLTLGAVYHLGFSTDLDSTERVDVACDPEYWGPYCGVPSQLADTSQLEWPAGWALGAAWRPSDRLTVAADYGRTEWSKARQRDVQVPGWDDAGNPTVVDLGTRAYPFGAEQSDVWDARVGAEYRVSYLSAQIPLRIGYYREQQPLLSSDFTFDEERPKGGVYDSYTAGFGVLYKSIQFDLGWAHTWGADSYPITVVEPEAVFDVSQKSHFQSDRFLVSLTYRF